VTVTLGNLRYDSHVADVIVSLALLPRGNSFTVQLPATVEMSAAPGDEAILQLDGGEGAETVITGKVRGVYRKLLTTHVVVADGGAELSNFRPAVTYEKQNGKDIVRALAAEVNVSVGTIDLDLPLVSYVAHPQRTAAEHVASLARIAGALAHIDSEGTLHVRLRPEPQAERALRYGRELLDYSVRERPGAPVRHVAIGNGPSSSPDAPNALRQTRAVLPSDAPAAGKDVRRETIALLHTPRGATAAGQARNKEAAAAALTLQATCFLLPALRPGMVIEVQDLPERLRGGPWLLTRVEHRLLPSAGGRTMIEAESADTTAAGGLLQAALSAVGGLL
jgi:hypothetical protein